tara:strand:- start:2736 stop:3356 length:621 start_codon:yes stop_codon:yes gene_type:complete
MSLSNFTELKTEIANFLNRDDLTNVIPTFIRLAEAKMNRDIRHWRMEARKTALLDTQFTSLPTDFLSPVRMTLDTAETKVLELAGTNEISKLRAEAGNATGEPAYYAMIDGSIEVFPSPDADYTIEMLYYEAIEGLSNSITTNWILTYYPDVYLYASLLQSAPYLMEDNRIPVWGAYYTSALETLNQENELAKTGGSGRRMKIRSY